MDYLSIKQWDEHEKPREKLASKGASSLTDSELLAILIASGYHNTNAIEVAKQILRAFDYNLNQLAKARLEELLKIKGVGEAKAIKILSALEIGRRRQSTINQSVQVINSSFLASSLIIADLLDKEKEEFWILLLNNKFRFIKKQLICIGGLAGTYVDIKLIFKEAILNNATNLILAHNHPSGNLSPSQEDITLTNEIALSARMLDINIADHLIIANDEYFSFADEGLLLHNNKKVNKEPILY